MPAIRKVASSSSTSGIHNSPAMPSTGASCPAANDPTIAPSVPPAAITPKKVLACSLENTSAAKLQKIETANRLNTLTQMKNRRGTQGCSASDSLRSTSQKQKRQSSKKR